MHATEARMLVSCCVIRGCDSGNSNMTALLRQSIYSRFAGYEDVNDAERLSADLVMRHVVVGGRAMGLYGSGKSATNWHAVNP